MDARAEDRIVVESERAAQSGRAGVIEEVLPRIRRASASGGTTGAQASRPLGRRCEDRAAQERARENLTDGRPRVALPRVHRQRCPPFPNRRPRCVLLPTRPLLLLLHLQADHRRLHPGSQGNGVGQRMLLRLPCHADPPRSRASGNGRSHVTGRGRMRCPNALVAPRENAASP
jgi:hypothetical protein